MSLLYLNKLTCKDQHQENDIKYQGKTRCKDLIEQQLTNKRDYLSAIQREESSKLILARVGQLFVKEELVITEEQKKNLQYLPFK